LHPALGARLFAIIRNRCEKCGLDLAAAAPTHGNNVHFEGAVMSKGMNQKKETKKQPVKTAKEKKAAKQEKKAGK